MSKILGFKARSKPFEIRSKSATKAEIVLYDAIGADWFGNGITAKSFSDELKALDKSVNEIDVRINSPGGDVFDGMAIYNRLKQHSAKKTVYIDGLAASIASIIALAGDEIVIGEGALYMVHLPWSFAMGNRNELENTINRLTDIEEQMVSIYQKRSGLSRSEIKMLLEKETWMDADQAIENKFVDKKFEETIPMAASALDKATWLTKRPKNMKTMDDAIKTGVNDLKNRISAFKARK